MKNKYVYLLLLSFIIIGFIFRYVGIQKNLSFWNDESHAAWMSRFILQRGVPTTDFGYNSGLYQIAFYYLTAFSFALLGITEFAGRLPSLLAGTFLIWLIFFVSKQLTKNKQIALMAAFLATFSQIQLAWSTQLRPYIWLELFGLLTTYYSYRFISNKKTFFDKNLGLGLFWSIIAVLFHGSGFISVFLICFAILIKIVQGKKYVYLISLIPLGIMSLLILRFSIGNAIPQLLNFDFRIWHYIGFFKEYIWLLLPAFFGSIYVWYKNKNLFIVLPIFVGIIFTLAIFKLNTQYVRYSLPAMPLLYILFSIGFFELIRFFTFRQSKKTVVLIYIAFSLGFIAAPIVKGKIIVLPKYYYSINADVRENPIVDYKYAFTRIKTMIEGKKYVVLMDAWVDRFPYYIPGRPFIFLTRVANKVPDPHFGTIDNVGDFDREVKGHAYGIVVVENWMSMTPPELQDHIKKTLKHEFTVNDLPYNGNDKWSISIYSWGFDK